MSRAIAVAATAGRVLLTWRNWIGLCLVAAGVTAIAELVQVTRLCMVASLAPVAALLVWSQTSPPTFERWYAGPTRRRTWRRRVRDQWPGLMQHAGLAATRHYRDWRDREVQLPQLRRVRTHGSVLELTVETRRGQTVEELNAGVPRLASSLKARTFRTRPDTGRSAGYRTVIELVMADCLTTPSTGTPTAPGTAAYDEVTLGRTQSGAPWQLVVRGRHTLVAGCSGAGKGSVMWGLCCGLAPAVSRDLVRLWGIDLKRGVELEMGAGLFTVRAYDADAALRALRALLRVIDERGRRMAGRTRLHEPTPGDPLHVLVIDELAALTAYADVMIRREAERLLSEILTQGRALGVVVVACVQDPRKDVVPVRGLFTQTVALRLRSIEETVMVLGEGAATAAPAHLISPRDPGTAWIVDDTGAVDRVRADFWPDQVITAVARTHPAAVVTELPAERPEEVLDHVERGGLRDARRPRSPRRPRAENGDLELVEVPGGDHA